MSSRSINGSALSQRPDQVPPHSELLDGVPENATSEQILQFLTNAASRLVRDPGCPCLYCTGQSSNSFLVLEKAWNARAAQARMYTSFHSTAPSITIQQSRMHFGSDFARFQPLDTQAGSIREPVEQLRQASNTRVLLGESTIRSPVESGGYHSAMSDAATPAQDLPARSQPTAAQPSSSTTSPAQPKRTSKKSKKEPSRITFHQGQDGQLTYQGNTIRNEPGMVPRDLTKGHRARAKADLSLQAQLAILAQSIRERQERQSLQDTSAQSSRQGSKSGSESKGNDDSSGAASATALGR